jgi:NAD(P)H-dependent FMN reductase
MSLNIALILGSVREVREGIKVANFLMEKCKERGFNVTLIDPKEYNIPLLDKRYSEYPTNTAPENLEKIHSILQSSDGFIIVTAEYNHTLPPALTNLMGYFKEEYNFKPAAIASYSGGPIAGMRAAVSARIMLGELCMISIKTIFGVGNVMVSFDKDGKPLDLSYKQKVIRFLDELEWYAKALKEARSKGVPF